MKGRWDRHLGEISRSTVERDMELGTAQEEQQRLRRELEQRKDDLERWFIKIEIEIITKNSIL